MSLCTTAHPLHTRFTNISGASVSETTVRPNPRSETVAVAELELYRAADGDDGPFDFADTERWA